MIEKKSGNCFHKGWYREWLAIHQILADNVTHNCYMLGTTTKLSMWFQVLRLRLHLKEIFSGLGPIVTEINIKKVQKQENKNVKIYRDGMAKSMQTR